MCPTMSGSPPCSNDPFCAHPVLTRFPLGFPGPFLSESKSSISRCAISLLVTSSPAVGFVDTSRTDSREVGARRCQASGDWGTVRWCQIRSSKSWTLMRMHQPWTRAASGHSDVSKESNSTPEPALIHHGFFTRSSPAALLRGEARPRVKALAYSLQLQRALHLVFAA